MITIQGDNNVIHPHNRSDRQLPDTVGIAIHREDAVPVRLGVVSSVLSIAATLGGLVGTNLTWNPDEPGGISTVLSFVCVAGFFGLYFTVVRYFGSARLGPKVISGGIVLERSSIGQLWRSRITAECPYCDQNGRSSLMTLRTVKKEQSNEVLWICTTFQGHHLGFDPTSLPALG